MLNILNGVHNFLNFVNENWTMIIVTIFLAISVVKKIYGFFSKSEQEKIDIAKKQVKETMLKLVTNAETDYLAWVSAGAIKRSQVIEEVFKKYPVLSKVANQEELIKWIDTVIDESLEEMRKIFAEQNKDESIAQG